MNEGTEPAWLSGHSADDVRPSLTWSPVQAAGLSRAWVPPTAPPPPTPTITLELSVAWPGVALSWVQECPSSTAHLAQMREHCPVSTHHGTEPALRLFPNDLEILAGPGLCPLVRYSETRGQWCDVRIGGCWLMFPNLRPALIVPTVPAPQDMWEALSP